MTTALPAPTADLVLDVDGLYADLRELFLACLADDLPPSVAVAFVEDFDAMRLAEWDAESKAELAAENAWLRAAEAGDAESEADLRYHEALWPNGYGC